MKKASDDRSFFGHPRGLSTLFFTEMWERFSFYGLRPLLILFMSAALFDGGFGIPRDQASAIVGIYAGSVYLASLPGGFIADRLLGLRRSILFGGILIAFGHLFIAVSSFLHDKAPFFVGLIFIVLGTGLLKPSISAIVGELYEENDSRRDAGFSLFYMGINIGAFFGQIIAGVLGESVGWHYGFGAAGIGMLVGILVFVLTAKRTLGSLGLAPMFDGDPASKLRKTRIIRALLFGLLIIATFILLVSTGALVVNPQVIAQSMTYVLVSIAVLYFAYMFLLGGLTGDEKRRVALIAILFVFAAIFWSAFEQAPTSLNLFARDFTDRELFGMTIPATWLQSVNSFFIFLCAPFFAMLWIKLGKLGKDPSSTIKFALGLFFAGIGFVFMIFAANKVVASQGVLKVSMIWLIASYFFQTLGELSLSPVGLSSMTKLAPRKFAGQMMGIWFLASALGHLIGGLVGGHVDPEKLEQMPTLFITTAGALFVAALILWMMTPFIKKFLTTTSQTSN